MQIHIPLKSIGYLILESNQTLLTEVVWERLNPSRWPISLDDLPNGCALVGGSVRDALLNLSKSKPDLDLVVPTDAIRLAKLLSDRIGATCVVLDEERDIARLVFEEWTIDFAKQIGASLHEDLFRRDFRINAIALTLCSKPEILDPLNGIKDLRDNILVAISEENLIDDPLRLLRGLRLISEFNFELDDQTKLFFQNHSKLLPKVAHERIKFEIQRLIRGQWADEVLPVVNQIGLLNPWRNKNTFVSSQPNYLRDAKNFKANELAIALPLARLVTLLSDEGLSDLFFSRKEIYNCKILRKWKKKYDGLGFTTLEESDLYKLHIELKNTLPALILDLPAKEQDVWLQRWRDPSDCLFHPSPPLNGFELQEILGVAQGPFLGEIINHLSREKAFNRLHTHDEAVQLARYLWKQKQPFL